MPNFWEQARLFGMHKKKLQAPKVQINGTNGSARGRAMAQPKRRIQTKAVFPQSLSKKFAGEKNFTPRFVEEAERFMNNQGIAPVEFEGLVSALNSHFPEWTRGELKNYQIEQKLASRDSTKHAIVNLPFTKIGAFANWVLWARRFVE